MKRLNLRATTSSLLIIALAAPMPGVAQVSITDGKLELCTDAEPPCLTDEEGMVQLPDGTIVPEAEAQVLLGLEAEAAEVEAEADAAAEAATAVEEAPAAEAEEQPAEAQAEPEEEAEPAAEPEMAAEEMPAEEMAEEEMPAEEMPAEEMPAEEMTEQADTEMAPAVEAEVEADAEAAVEAPPAEIEAETEVTGDAAAQEQAPVADEAPAEEMAQEAETPEAAPVEEAAEAPAEEKSLGDKLLDLVPGMGDEDEAAVTEDAPATETTADEAATTEAQTDEAMADEAATDEAMAEDATAEEATADAEMTEAEMAAETPTDAQELTEEELQAQAQAEAEAQADAEEEAQASAAAQADEGEADSDAEVTEETVAEGDTRTSGEEFQTSAKANGSSDENKRGLTNLEKALIVGAGAVAVGAILNNGDKVVSNSGDRVVVDRDGQLTVLRDDDVLLRRPGSDVRTETFSDGSTRTTVTRKNGTKIETIRTNDGRVLRRTKVLADDSRIVLFDDTQEFETVDVTALPRTSTKSVNYTGDDDALRDALAAANTGQMERRYSLSQIRNIRAVRDLAPEIELRNVTFDSGSAAIKPAEAEKLARLGQSMKDAIADNPREVFLIEGHTDAVGNATYNLALSDRRAESLALALTEYFDVPPENMVIQGYGERYLKVRTASDERANRRAAVRVITPLLGEVVASNN